MLYGLRGGRSKNGRYAVRTAPNFCSTVSALKVRMNVEIKISATTMIVSL